MNLKATWVWEEVSPEVFWLKVMAILRDEAGVAISGKSIAIYKASSPTYFSYILDKITDANGYIEYYFTGLIETNSFRFDFRGDGEYEPSSDSITVEYLIDPPTPPPPPSSSVVPILVGAGVLVYVLMRK